jgi:hypothetical protein
VVTLLLDYGADVNCTDKVSVTLSSSQSIVQLTLIENGTPPLTEACYRDHLEVVTVLLSRGAFIDIKDRVWTSLTRSQLSHLR